MYSFFATNENLHKDPKLHIEGKKHSFCRTMQVFRNDFRQKKLNFIPHVNYITNKCNKALQFLCVIAHTNWGADKETLLKLYRTLIRSKIEYGCFIYQSARKSYLKILNPIYHTGVRLALGAFKISSEKSLYAESYKTPPKLRCNNLVFKILHKTKSWPYQSSTQQYLLTKCKTLFQQKKKKPTKL